MHTILMYFDPNSAYSLQPIWTDPLRCSRRLNLSHPWSTPPSSLCPGDDSKNGEDELIISPSRRHARVASSSSSAPALASQSPATRSSKLFASAIDLLASSPKTTKSKRHNSPLLIALLAEDDGDLSSSSRSIGPLLHACFAANTHRSSPLGWHILAQWYLYREEFILRRNNAYTRIVRRPFVTNFFGDVLCIDQNEKLQAYRYHAYQLAVNQFGLWHRVTCDRGTENVLVIHGQNHHARLHEVPYVIDNPGRESARVDPSTSNTRAEYQWRFLNQGATRPMLLTLDTMFANHDFDLGNDVHKFCVATAACSIANVLIDRLFGQLVNRRIDRVGRPKHVMKNQFNTMPLIPGSLLDTGAVAAEYIAQGGSIILEMELRDPLSEWPESFRPSAKPA
ncbi:hypothetical protein BCR44DRAFT_59001 [Catenaria anguillulae PL171]|uniref:Uncharacterized protein n=1 Tax=Catenaria anguillulae PL171 TaxID=765915 RepID=A0A1Y2HKI1_9FUNG|nr:hypothetical protein BCR44DRAFT_59001 [Catenaria anguillulae PL171]